MKNIHKAGRPSSPMSFKEANRLVSLYEGFSTRELAEIYKVSQTTICSRLKKARSVIREQEQEVEYEKRKDITDKP